MNRLCDLPIKRKLTLVIMGTCSAVLFLACIALGAYQMRDFLRTKVRDTRVLADVVAKSTQGSLLLADQKDTEQKLLTLGAGPGVVAACIYTADGKVLAQYIRSGANVAIPSSPPPNGDQLESDALVVVRPVLINHKRVGTVLLRSDLQGLYDRLRVLGGIAGAVLLGCGLVAFFLSSWLQRPILQPILALTEAVRNIAEHKDYTIRLPARGRDETGLLTEAFNHLLEGIGERDTALRAANESLSRSEAQLKTVVENVGEGLVVSDLNGTLLHFNRAALQMHGFASMDECRGHLTSLVDIFELSALDGSVWTVDQWPMSRALRGEQVRDLEVKIRRLPGGSPRIFNYGGSVVRDSDNKPIMAILTISDITERKLAETRVVEQLGRLALFSEITRAVVEHLDLQSIFQVVVHTLEDQLPLDFCSVCLYDRESSTLRLSKVGARGEAFAAALSLGGDQLLPVGENGLARCVSGRLVYEPDVAASQFQFPQRLARAGLRAFVAAPLLVESEVFGVVIAARREAESFSSGDCEFLRQLSEHVALAAHQAQLHTALKKAYDDLRQSQQSAMQQERLRALGQMASGVAHDINNAISPVALYTESLLENEPNLSPRARDYLQTIQHSIEDVAQTVGRLREFYRQRDIQLIRQPVELNRLVKQVLDLSRARWSDIPQQGGAYIEAETDLSADLPAILGIESELREALLNLVFNAVDAMPDGGQLTVRTKVWRNKSADGPNDPSTVAVEVSDTGIGMDEDTRRRCLEPFFTTKGERGTGLGLAMVYGIAQRHGADIEIESAAGEGTTIRLILATTPDTHSALPEIPVPGPVSRLRILVIDDDPLLIKSLRDTLEADGHQVVTANGGQAGINAFQASQSSYEYFSVVITDLGMPYVDGRKVAAAIKGISPATPVLLLTGWGERLVAEADIPPHVDRVLNKPPKLRELHEALADCQRFATTGADYDEPNKEILCQTNGHPAF